MKLPDNPTPIELQQLYDLIPKSEQDRYAHFTHFYETEYFIEDQSGAKLPNTCFDNICRYCGSSGKFRTIAHLCPESLGNKHIISKDECDQCNAKFGKYDNQLANFFQVIRVVGGIKGKKGIPKYADQITTINVKVDGQRKTIQLNTAITKADVIIRKDISTVKVRFVSQSFRGRQVMRSLMKVGIALLDINELQDYQRVIKILQSHTTSIPFNLFPIYIWTMPFNLYNAVSIVTMKRKSTSQTTLQVIPERIVALSFANQFVQVPLYSDTDIFKIKQQALITGKENVYTPFLPQVATQETLLELGITIADPRPFDLCNDAVTRRDIDLQFEVDTDSLPQEWL